MKDNAPKSKSIINIDSLMEEYPYAFLFPNANSSKLNQHRLISEDGPFKTPLDLILTPSDYMALLMKIQSHLVVEKNKEQRSFTDFMAITFGAPSFQLFYPGLVKDASATE